MSNVGLVVALAVAGMACGSQARSLVVRTTDPAAYPCVLHAPRTLAPDFLVRQSLTIRAQRDGEPVQGELDAVVQKQGDTLLIIGFGPMNVKLFTLTHREDVIEFHQLVGPALPFSPRDIVVDVHRVFFKRLPAPAEATFTGQLHGELDGEVVAESWRDGHLRERRFTRPGSALRGAVVIELGPGCTAAACEPETVTLRNGWFDYTMALVNDEYESL